jgi:sulfatase-like protein
MTTGVAPSQRADPITTARHRKRTLWKTRGKITRADSLCSPSRAAFLTGKYSHINGIVNNSTEFPVNTQTFATLLRAAGYHTGFFGKWHMDKQRERPGFDEYVVEPPRVPPEGPLLPARC